MLQIKKMISTSILSFAQSKPASYSFRFILSFLTTLVFSCASPVVKVSDGKIEQKLKSVTGVSTAQLQRVHHKDKLDVYDLFALAVEETERMALVAENLEQAEAQKDSAFAGFFPTLTFRQQHNYILPSPYKKNHIHTQQKMVADALLGVPPQISAGSYGNLTSNSQISPSALSGPLLVLSVPIFSGGAEYTNYKSAKENIKVRTYQMRHEAGRLFLELAQNVFNILQIEKTIGSEEEIRDLTVETISELSKRVRLGQSNRTDLLNASAQLATLDATIQSYKDQLQTLRSDLSNLTGVNPLIQVVDIGEIQEPKSSLDEVLMTAGLRSDVLAADANVKVADAGLLKAWGGHLPSVTLNNYYRLPQHGTGTNKYFTAQLTFQVPLLSMGAVNAAVRQAESVKRQADLQLKQTRRFAVEEIRRAYLSVSNSQRMITAYEKAVRAAEQNYRLQSRDYKNHLNTILEVLTALTNLQNNRNEYNKAVLQHKLNLIWLRVATGEFPRLTDSTKAQSGEEE